MMITVNIRNTQGNQKLLCACDSNIVGKQFEEGVKMLDLSSEFYKGVEKDDEKVVELMKNCPYLNLVGEKTIGLAIENNIITKENVLYVKDIPYAQMMSE